MVIKYGKTVSSSLVFALQLTRLHIQTRSTAVAKKADHAAYYVRCHYVTESPKGINCG